MSSVPISNDKLEQELNEKNRFIIQLMNDNQNLNKKITKLTDSIAQLQQQSLMDAHLKRKAHNFVCIYYLLKVILFRPIDFSFHDQLLIFALK